MGHALGQYMTPLKLAEFVATQVRDSDVVFDLAAGDGALLKAVKSRFPGSKLLGFDIDKEMVRRASSLSGITVRRGNGLSVRITKSEVLGKLTIVGNPPFIGNTEDSQGWIARIFPDISQKKVGDRAEIQFLARALALARNTNGRIVFVMPIGFADGDRYQQVRAALMERFRLVRCIEVVGAPFSDTEARTVVLVIEASTKERYSTEISEYDYETSKVTNVYKGFLQPGTRLDARYHRAHQRGKALTSMQLKDLHVSVVRGGFSRKDAALNNIIAVHTSDLGKAVAGRISVQSNLSSQEMDKHVVARKGDILLSRTGSRVCWNPVVLHSGVAPITDHVFRIRAPKGMREVVESSFRHPAFIDWLQGISKGVCATVLTKRELLEMPVFAWPSGEEVTTQRRTGAIV